MKKMMTKRRKSLQLKERVDRKMELIFICGSSLRNYWLHRNNMDRVLDGWTRVVEFSKSKTL